MVQILDKLVTELGFDIDKRGLSNFDKRIKGIRNGMESISKRALVVGTALTGAAGFVTRTILGYEQEFNTLSSRILNATADDLANLRKQSQDLGATTSKSASEVVKAQTALASAGLSVNEVMEATPHVLNLAIAGNLDMATSADLLIGALKSYDLGVDQAAHVTDVYALASNKAATSIKEFGPALRQTAAIAGKSNLSLESTAAILGTLATGQLTPEQAGTGLRNILAILQEKPTPGIETALGELGLSFDTLNERVVKGDLIGAMQMLNSAGLDTASALEIFGREAGNAALVIAGASSGLDEFDSALQDSTGTADKMRTIMESGLPGGVAQFKSAVEGMQLALGDSGLTGAVTEFLSKGTEFLKWMRDANPLVRQVIVGVLIAGPIILGLGIALQAASFALGGFAAAITISRIATAWWSRNLIFLRIQLAALAIWTKISAGAIALWTFATNAGRIATLRFIATSVIAKGVMIAAAIATGVVTAAQWLLNIAMTANPIGIVIVAVAGLIAGLVLLYKKSETFRRIVWKMWEALKVFWPLLLGPIGLAIKGFQLLYKKSETFRKVLAGIAKVAGKVAGFFGKIFGGGDDGPDQKSADDANKAILARTQALVDKTEVGTPEHAKALEALQSAKAEIRQTMSARDSLGMFPDLSTAQKMPNFDMSTIGLDGQMPELPGMALPEMPNFDMSTIGLDGQMPELPGMALPEMPNFDMSTIGLDGQMPELPILDMPKLPNIDMSTISMDNQMPELPGMEMPGLPDLVLGGLGISGRWPELPDMEMPGLPDLVLGGLGISGRWPELPDMEMPGLPDLVLGGLGISGRWPELPDMEMPGLPDLVLGGLGISGRWPELPDMEMPGLPEY